MSGRAHDAGETLIEILLSVMILGIAVSALLFGMGTAATTSGLHTRQTQQAESLQNVVATLKAATYAKCDAAGFNPATAYSAALPAALASAGYVVTAQVVGYASGTGFVGSCPVGGDQGAQRLDVRVNQPDNRVLEERVTIVKRRPCPSLPC